MSGMQTWPFSHNDYLFSWDNTDSDWITGQNRESILCWWACKAISEANSTQLVRLKKTLIYSQWKGRVLLTLWNALWKLIFDLSVFVMNVLSTFGLESYGVSVLFINNLSVFYAFKICIQILVSLWATSLVEKHSLHLMKTGYDTLNKFSWTAAISDISFFLDCDEHQDPVDWHSDIVK